MPCPILYLQIPMPSSRRRVALLLFQATFQALHLRAEAPRNASSHMRPGPEGWKIHDSVKKTH